MTLFNNLFIKKKYNKNLSSNINKQVFITMRKQQKTLTKSLPDAKTKIFLLCFPLTLL